MTPNKNEKIKKKYSKPLLRRIELATDEVLATGCKTDSGGANIGVPTGCGIGNGCVGSGS